MREVETSPGPSRAASVMRSVLKVVVSAVTALGFGVAGDLIGPARSTPVAAGATMAGWLADPLAPPDPRTATPARVATFFAGLSAGDATALGHRYPEIVGNLDGAPAVLRYAANRERYPPGRGRQILAFDGRDDGRVVEVLGDLRAATRLVILVPGVDDDLANFDSGHGGVQRRALAWQARRLHDQIRDTDPAAHLSVVAWLGYDPPEGVRRDALREDRAAAGAIALNRFLDGLVLGRPDLAITVIGHSYGSTVAGLAAPRMTRQVTGIVAIGSPGMGVTDRSALRTTARVWAGSAPDDWIRRVPGVRVLGLGHGRLPIDPAFGALPLPCADVDGHDGYFVPGNSALRAMARIALGDTHLSYPSARQPRRRPL
ncbi:alpha/beta hydrolase [Actinoplanes sp. NPDC089786]|uniref:alpha/beta hydrolase n=1 Tax=Actinoplanes sp. NPDC089786 TaxID=3155185 RepID=UPI00341750E4